MSEHAWTFVVFQVALLLAGLLIARLCVHTPEARRDGYAAVLVWWLLGQALFLVLGAFDDSGWWALWQ